MLPRVSKNKINSTRVLYINNTRLLCFHRKIMSQSKKAITSVTSLNELTTTIICQLVQLNSKIIDSLNESNNKVEQLQTQVDIVNTRLDDIERKMEAIISNNSNKEDKVVKKVKMDYLYNFI